jgi:hypothetical protein
VGANPLDAAGLKSTFHGFFPKLNRLSGRMIERRAGRLIVRAATQKRGENLNDCLLKVNLSDTKILSVSSSFEPSANNRCYQSK